MRWAHRPGGELKFRAQTNEYSWTVVVRFTQVVLGEEILGLGFVQQIDRFNRKSDVVRKVVGRSSFPHTDLAHIPQTSSVGSVGLEVITAIFVDQRAIEIADLVVELAGVCAV